MKEIFPVPKGCTKNNGMRKAYFDIQEGRARTGKWRRDTDQGNPRHAAGDGRLRDGDTTCSTRH